MKLRHRQRTKSRTLKLSGTNGESGFTLIETAIAAHTPKQEIAALCLSNADCQTVAEVLRDADVPGLHGL